MPYTNKQCRYFATNSKSKLVPKDWKEYCKKDSKRKKPNLRRTRK